MRADKPGQTSNIILVGFMGTGKTSTGQLLADKLRMTFIDMDDVIEEREGKPISSIFSENGEPHFRSLERNLVKELSKRTGLVIATGGGIVLNPDNITDFSKTGIVVCLLAKPEAILKRLAGNTSRPLLAGDDKMHKILSLMESRRLLYEAIPNRIDTTDLAIKDVVKRILTLWKSKGN